VNILRFFFALTIFLLAFPVLAQDPAPSKALHVGLDVYAGVSDIPGQRRPTDQLWAGQTVFTPSVAYATWTGQSTSAKVSLGVGEATLRRPRLFRQPVEAWVRQELNGGAAALSVGRFFAPFGQQEWQYEAREGAMWEAGHLTVAVQNRGVGYGRWTTTLAPGAILGVSAARGRGFSYGSTYTRGAALDLLAERGGWRVRAESDRFFQPEDGAESDFRFDFAQLAYTKNKRVQPFLSRYDWRDSRAGGGMGSFRSEIVGANWTLSPSLSLETATALAGGRRVAWGQLRFTQEW
jgi:hypothetical protein